MFWKNGIYLLKYKRNILKYFEKYELQISKCWSCCRETVTEKCSEIMEYIFWNIREIFWNILRNMSYKCQNVKVVVERLWQRNVSTARPTSCQYLPQTTHYSLPLLNVFLWMQIVFVQIDKYICLDFKLYLWALFQPFPVNTYRKQHIILFLF